MRKLNWPTIIAKEITKHKSTPFVWGESDCCLVVADIVKAFSDIDIAEGLRGKYKTAKGSLMALKRHGEGDIASTVDRTLNRKPRHESTRGDVVLVKTEAGESLGLLFNTRVWAMSQEGLVDLPVDDNVLIVWGVN